MNEKEIKLTCVKKQKIKIKAVSYSQNLKPEIAELHEKFGVTDFTKNEKFIKILCSCNK